MLRAMGGTADIVRARAVAPAARMRVALEAIERDAIDLAQIEDAIAEERRRG